jgi:hypothetical protein
MGYGEYSDSNDNSGGFFEPYSLATYRKKQLATLPENPALVMRDPRRGFPVPPPSMEEPGGVPAGTPTAADFRAYNAFAPSGPAARPAPPPDPYAPQLEQAGQEYQAALNMPRAKGFRKVLGAIFPGPGLGAMISGEYGRNQAIQGAADKYDLINDIITKNRAQQMFGLTKENIESEIGHRGAQEDYWKGVLAAKPDEEWSTVPNVYGPGGKPVQQEKRSGQYRVVETPGVTVKEPTTRDMTAKAGMMNGKPAWAVQTPAGWADVDTHQPMPGFEPMPNYGMVPVMVPTMVSTPQGMVPGTFTSRGPGAGTYQVAPTAGGVSGIPHAAQTEINKSLSSARDADNRLRTMEQNLKEAMAGGPGAQQAMISLTANHMGMTTGAIKGMRQGTQLEAKIEQSAPMIGRVEAHWDENGYLSGLVLTPAQMKAMVQLAREKRANMWKQAKETAGGYGVPDAVQMPADVDTPGAASGGLTKDDILQIRGLLKDIK